MQMKDVPDCPQAGVPPPVAAFVSRRQRLAGLLHKARILPWMGRVRSALRSDLRILAYHRVLETTEPEGFQFDPELISASADAFRQQMQTIKRDFHPMRFDEVVDRIGKGSALPARAILVTFDDGYDDNYRVAYPILRELGMSAMFFVSTGHIDSGMPYQYDWLVHMLCTTKATEMEIPELGVAWQLPPSLQGRREVAVRLLEHLKSFDAPSQASAIALLARAWGLPRKPHPDCRPMTWGQLREMHRGGMEIGSHGVDHNMLAKMPQALMEEEIRKSKETLERELAAPALALSYPVGGYGAFDSQVIDAVRGAGFSVACSYIAGVSAPDKAAMYSLRRLHVERSTDAAWFTGMLELPELFNYATHDHPG